MKYLEMFWRKIIHFTGRKCGVLQYVVEKIIHEAMAENPDQISKKWAKRGKILFLLVENWPVGDHTPHRPWQPVPQREATLESPLGWIAKVKNMFCSFLTLETDIYHMYWNVVGLPMLQAPCPLLALNELVGKNGAMALSKAISVYVNVGYVTMLS